MTVAYAVRQALRAGGYSPIPVKGKSPVLPNWQDKIDTGTADFNFWDERYAAATNTGALTGPTPALDIDIKDPDAAVAIEETVKDWVGDSSSEVLVRFGNPPKRAIPFRTDRPFSKIVRAFQDAHGVTHRVEFLGEGQQIVVHGTHPDTGKPYSWHGNRGPDTVAREQLPPIDEAEAHRLIGHCADILVQQFGFTEVAAASTNGGAHVGSERGPVDAEAELAAMTPDNVNDTHCRVIPSLLWRAINPNDVVTQVAAATMAMAQRHGLKEWCGEAEARDYVTPRVRSTLKNLFMEKYDAATGEVPPWLCPEWHEEWISALAQGLAPNIGRNASGFFVRGCDRGGKASGCSDAPSIVPGTPRAEHAAAGVNSGKKTKGPFIIKPFAYFDPALLPQREWLYGRHYQRRTVSCTTAPGGFGKTTNDMIEGVAMCSCRDLLGEQPIERLRVWIHNGEDNLAELQRRIAAICQYYKIDMRELEGWLFLTSGSEFPLKVATGFSELRVDDRLIDQIAGQIAENKIDVAILDPLITLHSVSEQDNVRMDAVIRLFSRIADSEDCAVELSHHMRKMPAGVNADYTAADIRGATAIFDAVRSARVINRMSEKEGAELGLPEFERSRYLRVDKAKGNYSPAAKAVWRKFENVELPNGDDVGVLMPWNYPGQGLSSAELAEIERTAELVFLQLLHKYLLQGRAVSDKTRGSYAPKVFARESEAKAAKVNVAMFEGAMERLFAAGKIKLEGPAYGGRPSRLVPA